MVSRSSRALPWCYSVIVPYLAGTLEYGGVPGSARLDRDLPFEGRVRLAICRGMVWVHVAYFPGTLRDRGVPARYATITLRTRRVCVVIVAYPRGTPRDRSVPRGYATITLRTRRVCVVIVAYRRGTRRDRGIPGG